MSNAAEISRNIQTDDDGASSIVAGGEDVVEQLQKRRFRGMTSAVSGLECAKVEKSVNPWPSIVTKPS